MERLEGAAVAQDWRTPGEAGMFVVDVLHDDANQDQTFLVGAEHTDKIEVTGTRPAVIAVIAGDARSVR